MSFAATYPNRICVSHFSEVCTTVSSLEVAFLEVFTLESSFFFAFSRVHFPVFNFHNLLRGRNYA